MTESTIVKHIEHICTSGRKVWDVFSDWLDMTEATLVALPRHAESVAKTHQPAEDTPETQALWARLRQTYTPNDFGRFRDAFQALLETAHNRQRDNHSPEGDADVPADERGTWDILGNVYMQLAVSSHYSGQYFTPWAAARLMAYTALDDVASLCRRHVADAIDRGPWGKMGLANGASITQPGKEKIMLMALADNYAHLEPITINDPACGSGIMLLAAASYCPQWALDYAVVRLYGQDIDRQCVQMARCNMMLYGLNGYGVRLNAAIAGAGVTVKQTEQDAPPPVDPVVTLPAGKLEQGGLYV